jgi:hypothetical protein
MERSKYIIILLLLLITKGFALASEKATIYKAYVNNDMRLWKATIDAMETKKGKSSTFILELVNYQYGYIGWCIGLKKNDEAGRYLKLAEANVALLEKNSFKSSYLNAYKSAFYGFRIGLNVLNAPFLGPKSVSAAELAMKQDNTNPFGFIQYANAQYYMPAVFGGSKSLAIKYYQRAEKLMNTNPVGIREDWNYLSLLAIIGKAYDDTGDLKAAKLYYERILTQEPGFLWVKNDLYPNLLKKLK